MQESPLTLGQSITKYRRKKRWTQRDLARQLQINHSMVARWEMDKVQPRIDSLGRLADAFGVSIEQLLGEPEETTTLATTTNDSELNELLTQVQTLQPSDREALKTVVSAMLTRSRVQAAIGA